MLLKQDATDERLRGSYYTPIELAEYIVKWSTQVDIISRILEPSCGDGVFLKCLNKNGIMKNSNITAIELDERAAHIAHNTIRESRLYNLDEFIKQEEKYKENNNLDYSCNIVNEDFYKAYEDVIREKKFQVIVGNPPYIRYQYLTETQREEQSNILKRNGMKSNKLINAWVSFVVACIEMMDDNSRIGLVIPAELLQVAYAEDLRKFLMKSLQRITIVTFKELIFPDVEQEVIVLLGEKDVNHNDEHKLRIVEYRNIDELVKNEDMNNDKFCDVEINESKWTRYFLKEDDIKLIEEIKEDNRFIRFNEVAKIEVGITTGNNDYFCVNEETTQQYDLKSVCRPLIARSVNISGVKFTIDDWKENIERGAKTYLIDFPEKPYEEYLDGHKKYIEYGEINDQNKGYKCSIRDRWYRVPSIWVPDAFFLRRNHLYPKFMLNSDEVNAVSTDTMHRVKFNNGRDKNRILLSYYNSITLAFTEIEGRSYGGGVLEILPKEVGRIVLPNLNNREIINDQLVNELINKIDMYVRNNNDITSILDEIDEYILVQKLGLRKDVVVRFREMWLRLRERRMLRGKRKNG